MKRKPTRIPKRAPTLTDGQIATALTTIEAEKTEKGKRDAAMIEVMGCLALRRCEVAIPGKNDNQLFGLRWRNVKFQKDCVTFRFFGKGDVERKITVPGQGFPYLRAWQRIATDREYVFPLKARQVENVVKERFAFTGKDVSCHSLRRSCATKAYKSSGLSAAQSLLGHRSPIVTAKYIDLESLNASDAIASITADYAEAIAKIKAVKVREGNAERKRIQRSREREEGEGLHLVDAQELSKQLTAVNK